MSKLLIVVAVASFVAGFALHRPAAVSPAVVYRTPQECKNALDLDTDIFGRTGDALQSFTAEGFDSLTSYITSHTNERTSNVSACEAAL